MYRDIETNEYGRLVERTILEGETEYIFFLSQGGFNKAYDAHQKWLKKLKDKLDDENNWIIDDSGVCVPDEEVKKIIKRQL